jgi:hypothetical protein
MLLSAPDKPAAAQVLSPYSEFQAMTVAQMQNLQGKLTFVGDRRRESKTLLFRAAGQASDLTVFVPFYRSQFLPGGYNSDHQTFRSFSATTQDLKAMIDSVASVSQVVDGDVDTGGFLSFALSNVIDGNTKVFESVVNPATGKLLFGRLLGAFATNDSAGAVLSDKACEFGMLPSGPPNNVTSQVAISLRGFRKDRRTGQYVGRVRITNTSQQTIGAPIIFVFRPPANIDAVAPAGLTCAIDPSGSPYVTVSAGSSLGPGQHMDVTLRFDNLDGDPIALSSQQVFSGPGFR